MADLFARKTSLEVNPNTSNADITITNSGSIAYWVVFALMAVSTLGFMGHSWLQFRERRIFHYIAISITLVAAISYYTMAANLGYSATAVEFSQGIHRPGNSRQIFYVRYIDWFVTTPLLLTGLLLTARVPWPTIVYTVIADEVMIICGLVGALVPSVYKWGYFAVATLALLYIMFNIGVIGRLYTQRHRTNPPGAGAALQPITITRKWYTISGLFTTILWCGYPIAWGLCEGGNLIFPDVEAGVYGVLDILAKPVFGVLLLVGHSKINKTDEERRKAISMRDFNRLDIPENRGIDRLLLRRYGGQGSRAAYGLQHPSPVAARLPTDGQSQSVPPMTSAGDGRRHSEPTPGSAGGSSSQDTGRKPVPRPANSTHGSGSGTQVSTSSHRESTEQDK